ncbi:hypothetical protein Hanom_Chr14g01270401 [Helianthus anomalus]
MWEMVVVDEAEALFVCSCGVLKRCENNQTLFLLHSADIWSTSSRAHVCKCGPQTADLLHLKKQTPPKSRNV